jgi:hypothetical protein
MIEVAISYGFGEDNRYRLEEIPPQIQLASYKYDPLMRNLLPITNALLEAKTDLQVVHLPLNTLNEPVGDILDVIFHFNQVFACEHFVIHPNKGIEDFLWYYLEHKQVKGKYDYSLCIETFQWRAKKKIRSPLDIMEWCIQYPEFSMCVDTSHIEELWFDHKIMRSLLKYTSVVHLSNRAKGHGSHMPFNSPHGDLNLVRFVKDLKHLYNWNGIIVLEYMPEHQHKLLKNYYYIKRLLE